MVGLRRGQLVVTLSRHFVCLFVYSFSDKRTDSHIYAFIHSFHPFIYQRWKPEPYGQDAEVKYMQMNPSSLERAGED